MIVLEVVVEGLEVVEGGGGGDGDEVVVEDGEADDGGGEEEGEDPLEEGEVLLDEGDVEEIGLLLLLFRVIVMLAPRRKLVMLQHGTEYVWLVLADQNPAIFEISALQQL